MSSQTKTRLPVAMISAAWLIPNHYIPWPAAWNDVVAISALLLLILFIFRRYVAEACVSWQLTSIAGLISSVVLMQVALGQLTFIGDAFIVTLYVGLFFLAVIVGRLTTRSPLNLRGTEALVDSWVFVAILSTGIALAQWSGTLALGIYGVDLPPGGRPFANLAQPNNFSTLCFIGLCGMLWLYQLRRVNSFAFWLGTSFLLFGMVMSQSRTGWLQIGLLTVWLLFFSGRVAFRITRKQTCLIGVIFVAGIVAWPIVCDFLYLSVGRSIGDQMQAGVRLPYWLMMLDAIGKEPLWGYGWQQIGMAQQSVALAHPAINVFFEHSHNLILDLLLWNGIPIGGLIIGLLVWWLVDHIRGCKDARVVLLLAIIGGLLTHAMLELPLEYAYFLIPFGLTMGAVEGLSPVRARALKVPRWLMVAATTLLTVLFLLITKDYLLAEENHRSLRLESARIGVSGIVTPAPSLMVLTQLEAFLKFARTEATPNMSPAEVDWMRKVSARYGYPPVMFRYALATGLNGEPEIARKTLDTLCRIHEPDRCSEAHDAWLALQQRYPQLATIAAPAVVDRTPAGAE